MIQNVMITILCVIEDTYNYFFNVSWVENLVLTEDFWTVVN